MTKLLDSYSPTIVREFYASYRDTIVLLMRPHLGLIRFSRLIQLDHTLVRRVILDIREETIHRVMFGLDYIIHASTMEFNHRLSIIQDHHIIQDIKHRAERVERAR